MTAMAARNVAKPVMGHAKPRIAPPTPARSDVKGFRETAEAMAIVLMPWQVEFARYLTATGKDGRLLYREVCGVVARQQGKTTLMKPHIIRCLRAGRKVMHIAQNRELPRQMFGIIADALSGEPDLFPKRRGRVIWPRYGSGQEEIALLNGGSYRIAASSRGGGRGWPNDVVIIDELREMTDREVVGAVEPTLTMSVDPQMIYLSNAGADDSVVLNDVRDRAGQDDALAYLEWSASPERRPDDIAGWAEANPALGHYPSVLRTLETAYRKHKLADTLSIFETEHLCRWVVTMLPRLFPDELWQQARAELEKPVRPYMGVNMDPSGTRASAVFAWRQADGTMAIRQEAEVEGYPINTDALGKDLSQLALKSGCPSVGYAPWTDAALAKHFKNAKAVDSRAFASDCGTFVRLATSGKLRWDIGEAIGADLAWVGRKPHESGAWTAVKAKEDHPVTAILAAIRAVGLASDSPLQLSPRFQ